MPEDIKAVDEYLSQFTFSATSTRQIRLKLLTEDQRRDLYRANKKVKNYGSILDLKGSDMPITDLLVYSFPCQDLSTGGLGKGMKKGSGTRSGLLWEIERILNELNEEGRLPKYLLMENVKAILAESNREDLNEWLSFLNSIGYENSDPMILDATKFGIPQLVIGLTIVAMGTSAPEAAVSITAAFDDNAGITIGNVVGSNILNILIILGITALVNPIKVQKSSQVIDIPVAFFASVLLLILGWDGKVSRLDGIIMLVIFVAYLVYLFWDAKRPKKLDSSTEVAEETVETKNVSLPKSLFFTVIGLVLIVAGSNCVVESATFIAEKAGLSQRFIGLTIVALGTSLPELFTSVTAAMKKNSDIAVGNIVVSNSIHVLYACCITATLNRYACKSNV